MSQTSYSTYMSAGIAGLKYDAQFGDTVDAAVSAEASAEIPFGTLVVLAASGSTERAAAAILPATNATRPLLGFVVHSHTYQPGVDLGTTGLKPKTGMDVMRRGRLWVIAENAVSRGDSVFVRYAGTGQKGGVRGAAVNSETFKLNSAQFITAASAGALAVIEFDLVAGATAGA